MRSLKGIVVIIGICAAVAARADTTFDAGGFEGFTLGPVAGQYGWQNESSVPNATPQIIENAFTIATGHNKVLEVDPLSISPIDYAGAYLPFGQDLFALGAKQIQISFDQFRGTLNQSAYVLEGPGASRGASSYLAYEYGLDQSLYPTGTPADFGIPLTAGVWQRVNLLVDMEKQEVYSDVDGIVPFDPLDPSATYNPQHFDLGVSGKKEFRGIGLRVYGTNRGTPNGPNYFDNLVVTGGPVIPEPSSLALLAAALPALSLRRRRRS